MPVAFSATLRPSFYAERLREPSLCRALCHLAALAALLSLPTSLCCLCRLSPLLSSTSASHALDAAQALFPAGLELVFNGSHAQLRPEPAEQHSDDESGRYVCWEEDAGSWCALLDDEGLLRPIRLELPQQVIDFFSTDLPQPFGLSPARIGALLLGVDTPLLLDGFPNVNEYAVGEVVHLQRGWRTLLYGAGWEPARVLKRRPAPDVRNFIYTLSIGSGMDKRSPGGHADGKTAGEDHSGRAGAEGGGPTAEGARRTGDEGSSDTFVPAATVERSILDVRRAPALVLASEEMLEASALGVKPEWGGGASWRERMLALRASVVVSPSQVHILQGFTPYFGQYWQYESMADTPVRSTRADLRVDGSGQTSDSAGRGQLYAAARMHAPIGMALALMCAEEEGALEERTASNPEGTGATRGVVVCSRSHVARRLAPLRSQDWIVRGLEGIWGLHTWAFAAATLLVGYTRQLLYTVPFFVAVQVPAVYVGVNLLRHVDSPATSLRVAAVMAAYASTLFWTMDEALAIITAVAETIADRMQDAGMLCTHGQDGGKDAGQEDEYNGGSVEQVAGSTDGQQDGSSSTSSDTCSEETFLSVDGIHSTIKANAPAEAPLVSAEAPQDTSANSRTTSDLARAIEPTEALYRQRLAELEALHEIEKTLSDHGVEAAEEAAVALAATLNHRRETGDFAEGQIRTRGDDADGTLATVALNEPSFRRLQVKISKPSIESRLGVGLRSGPEEMRFHPRSGLTPAEAKILASVGTPTATCAASELDAILGRRTVDDSIGMSGKEGGDEGALALRLTGARVVEVEKGSLAAIAGIQAGDWVVSVDGTAVDGAIDAASLMRESTAPILTIERGPPGITWGLSEDLDHQAQPGTAHGTERWWHATNTHSSRPVPPRWRVRAADGYCYHSFNAESFQTILETLKWLQRLTLTPVLVLLLACCFLRAKLRAFEGEEEMVRRGGRRGPSGVFISTNAAEAARAPAVAGDDEGTLGGADEELVCRICFSGAEAGKLVSPCLCSGSMRFVHLECLETWRRRSANPQSYYQCENCLYRYSFRRALYAQVLRSALVLHLVSLVALLILLTTCSVATQAIDRRFFGSSLSQLEYFQLPPLIDDIGDFSSPTRRGDMDSRGRSSLDEDGSVLLPIAPHLKSWLDGFGIDLPYVMASLSLVGVAGFLSLGLIGPMLWHRGQHDAVFLLIVLVGVSRAFWLIYKYTCRLSASLLTEAEKLVVDVGVSAPVHQATSTPATRQPQAEARIAAQVVAPPLPTGDQHHSGDGMQIAPTDDANESAMNGGIGFSCRRTTSPIPTRH